MDKKQRALAGLDLRKLEGLEIGALTTPLVTREDGAVLYVDHADTETLRRKYADHPNVDTRRIVPVDAVWGSNTLQEALNGRRFDYAVASHLVEHVPDLLGWLEEVHTVLRPQGDLRLIVPDRRFTFDHERRESVLSDLVYARMRRARVPQLPAILDHVLEVVELDLGKAWAGTIDRAGLRRLHTYDHAVAVGRDMLENGTYHDVHCWVFTPRSFAQLLGRAASLGLVRFRCLHFFDTHPGELDFIVHLQSCDDRELAARSWQEMADACAELPPRRMPLASPAGPGPDWATERGQLEASLRAAEEKLKRVQEEHLEAVRALEAIRASTSWRLGAPLRQSADWMRRRLS